MGKRGIKSKLQDVTVLERYLAEGKTNNEIAEIYKVPVGTVKSWITQHKLGGLRKRGKKAKKESGSEKKSIERTEVAAGINADRHLCKTCRYRTKETKRGCDYIVIVGHSRGCDPEECNVNEKGRRPRKKLAHRINNA